MSSEYKEILITFITFYCIYYFLIYRKERFFFLTKEAFEYNIISHIHRFITVRLANNWHVSVRDKGNLVDGDSERWRVSFLLYRQIPTYPAV